MSADKDKARWTPQQVAQLKADYRLKTPEQIAHDLNLPARSVWRKITGLGLAATLTAEEKLARRRVTMATCGARGLETRARNGQSVWSDADVEFLRQAYVIEGRRVAEIAVQMERKPADVASKAHTLGFPAMRSEAALKAARDAERSERALLGHFIWTDERLATLRRLYGDEGQGAAAVAEALKCRPRDVSRKVHKLGLSAARPDEVKRAAKLAALQKGRAVKGARPVVDPDAPVVSDADLVAAFMARGKVTQLPPGHACGTTRWESMLGTARVSRGLTEHGRKAREAGRIAAARKADLYARGAA